MKKKRYYLAYGSNLSESQMAFRCPTAEIEGVSVIKDYKLAFRGFTGCCYATIVPCKNSTVPVLVWSLEPSDEKSLDRYEGYPNFYIKEDFKVELNGKEITAMVYIMTGTRSHAQGLPSMQYFGTLKEGYEKYEFEEQILLRAYYNSVGEKQTEYWECPVCRKITDERPALSRADNKTSICPECGVLEALKDANVNQENTDKIISIIKSFKK